MQARNLEPGGHSFCWSLRDHAGRPVPKGIYFLTLQIGQQEFSGGKLIVLR
jgi:hypothetical protein